MVPVFPMRFPFSGMFAFADAVVGGKAFALVDPLKRENGVP